MPRARAAFTGESAARDDHLGDIIPRDFHFHRADSDFKMVVVQLSRDQRWTAHRFQFDRVSLGNMLHHLRLSMRIALVRASTVGYDCRIKLFAKFTAQLADAAFGIFGELLRRCPILDSIYRLACVIFEIAQQALQLLLHFSDFGLLLFLAFSGQCRFFVVPDSSSRARSRKRSVSASPEVGMKAVEKLADILGLRSQPRSR